MYIYYKLKRVVTFLRPHVKLSSDLYWIYKYNITWNGEKKKFWVRSIGKKCWPRVISSFHCSLLDIASGSLNVGGLSAPLLEYSLHLLAAAAALFALSFAPSSENHTTKLLFFNSKLNISIWIMQSLGISSTRYCPIMITRWTCSMQQASIRHGTSLLLWMIGWDMN